MVFSVGTDRLYMDTNFPTYFIHTHIECMHTHKHKTPPTKHNQDTAPKPSSILAFETLLTILTKMHLANDRYMVDSETIWAG